MFKRVGILALVLSAGMAVMEPAVAKAADWHDRDGHHDRDRRWNRGDRHERNRDRDWRRDEWREHRWRENRRDRDFLYFNFTPAPRYYYYTPAPNYRYPYDPYSGYPY